MTERIAALDATRGAAVMGILLINIVSFAMPGSAYVNPTAWGGTTPADLAVWTVNQLFFEGRMRGLFALLFGASALLVRDRAAAAGANPVAVHLRRMAVLALLGLAHMLLVWDGDVLLHYAAIGLVVWAARDWTPRALAQAGAGALALHTLWWSIVFAGALLFQASAGAPGASADTIAQARAMLAEMPGPGDPSIAQSLANLRGDYAGIVAHRVGNLGYLPAKFVTMMGGETLGYMLIGMALFRSGFFTGGWSAANIRRLMWRCYAVSLPVLALLTWWAFESGFDRFVLMGNFLGWSVPFRVACAVGHAALAVLLVRRFAAAAPTARVAAVGRMALSNYLATSIVMTTIFYGYGFGLFGQVARAPLYLFVVAMWAAMLLWSQPWLAHFRYGPAEWLWRSLARGRVERFRGAAS